MNLLGMDFWAERRVLVTGATGLMGGWLVKALLAEGTDVIALVRDQVPHSMLVQEELLDCCSVVRGSLEDFDLLKRTLSEYCIDTLFHLAAQPLVGVAKLDPMTTLETNVRGTWHVLEAARVTGVKQVVVASSDKAYGSSDVLPYTESHPVEGQYPYDVSKSCTDLISRMYAVTYKVPVAIVRCANLYGGGDLNFSRSIPGVIQATLRGEPFVIRSDGKFVRDFLYVKDAAAGYMKVAESLAQDPRFIGEAFNLSLEVRLTVMDVVETVLRLMNRSDLRPVVLNQASGEIREQYMACEKARREIGWQPAYSFEDGIRETIVWYRSCSVAGPARKTATAGAAI